MNALGGTIFAIESAAGIHHIEVDVGGVICTATVIGEALDARWVVGARVTLSFSELDVSLARDLTGLLSIRNVLAGTIRELEIGEVLARVRLDLALQSIDSVITRRSALRLGLAPGMRVDALIKANDMRILPEVAP
jgi:molybdate transport system regulatory protein